MTMTTAQDEGFKTGFHQCLWCGQWIWATPHADTWTIPRRYWLTWVHSLTEYQRCDVTRAPVATPTQIPLSIEQELITAYNIHRNQSERPGQAWMNALSEVAPIFYNMVSDTVADCTYDNGRIPLFKRWVFGMGED